MRLTGIFKVFLLCIFAVLSNTVSAQFYTGSQQEFGKNRLQHDEFLWQFYKFDQFHTYFYAGGRDLAEYTAKTAKIHLAELNELLDFQLKDRIHFVIYNKLSHFRQSNVGLENNDTYNIGGVTRIVGNKIFLYYEGDHAKLDEQIRSGLANVIINQMMYGGNWKDVLKNSTLLTLPEWYTDGLIAFLSKEWDADIDSRVRDGILTGKYDKFNRLSGAEATIVGQSIWNYIAEVYGENVIPNILYMTRISRNIESGFLFVIGTSLKTLSAEYLDYYRKRYEIDEKFRTNPTFEPLAIKTKKTRTYSQFKASPNGRYIAYVSNEMGQYKIWVHDLSKEKRKCVYKREHKLNRIIDESFPIIAWHPGGAGFSFVTEEKGELLMNVYTVETKKISSKALFALEKVLDFAYSKDGRKMIFSAVKQGQTDLYLYDVIGNRQTQLTFDHYDDLYPRFADKGNSIIFASNRMDDTLRTKEAIEPQSKYNDIFLYDLKKRSNYLTRITNTPVVNETHPMQYDTLNYTYLSDQNGIRNRYVAQYDSVISHIDTAFHYRYFTRSVPVTNYSRSIQEFELNALRGKYTQIIYEDGQYKFYMGKIADDKLLSADALKSTGLIDGRNTALGAGIDSASAEPIEVTTIKVFEEDETEGNSIDIENYSFGDSPDTTTGAPADSLTIETTTITFEEDNGSTTKTGGATAAEDSVVKPTFILPQQSVYRLNFATDYVVTQVDNSFNNQSYQRYTGPGAVFFNPGFNGLLKLGISDVFEDHRVVGALRLSGNLNSNEYFLAYHDLSKRLDRTYLFRRQTLVGVDQFSVQKIHTNEAKYLVKWPFSEVASIRGTLNLRNDRITTAATDFNNLAVPNVNHYLGSAKVEYIFDNTIGRGLNLYNGIRFKLWGEYYQEIDNPEGTDFKVVGLDFRYYQKIHRDLIFAGRLSASSSFGSQRLLYYLGGVDNWLIPRFDNDIPVAQDQGYAFQTIATPMRGFFQNVRNGNNFALVNAEIRWPVFKYLLNRPIKSDFIENFQIIGFSDAGTAFTGSDPYSEDNTFNVQQVVLNPLTITIQNQREPIVWGYGFGVRSRIWGYFVRADWAWGVDDGVVLDNVFYLSLSLDF